MHLTLPHLPIAALFHLTFFAQPPITCERTLREHLLNTTRVPVRALHITDAAACCPASCARRVSMATRAAQRQENPPAHTYTLSAPAPTALHPRLCNYTSVAEQPPCPTHDDVYKHNCPSRAFQGQQLVL